MTELVKHEVEQLHHLHEQADPALLDQQSCHFARPS